MELVDYALMAGRAYQSTRDKINWIPGINLRGQVNK